ncbi:MAG: 3-deoxy-D-manno-octulosonic acid transferase [Niastella sp.]|nr:3-deoxy-D-manno-octulosonic acid transferase [Niastella sp.]
MFVSRLLYHLFLIFYRIGIHIAALANPKAQLWIKGRKKIIQRVEKALTGNKRPVIWMHCASLGEFEQGRPVLEICKKQYPGACLVVSFFSPSGYEVRKGFKGADHVFYLPADSKKNAESFIQAINPSLVLWVKYEYWFYYLTTLKNKNIPVILFSALFRPQQPFFMWYGALWKKMLGCFQQIFVQDNESKLLLQKIGIAATVSGDTRYDRVIATAENFEPLPAVIERFCSAENIMVAGSTWAEDEEELQHYIRLHPSKHFIIAPHETENSNIEEVKKRFPGCILYSALTGDEYIFESHVLIMDNVGMLSRLYKYAQVCYIGGGFGGDGLHNILEPAVYGRPVIFGPQHEKQPEATALLQAGGAFEVTNALMLEVLLDKLFMQPARMNETGLAAKKFVYDNRGATSHVMEYIYKNLRFTK